MPRIPIAIRQPVVTLPPPSLPIRLPLKPDCTPTNVVLGDFAAIFAALPIIGQSAFSYSLGLEGQPSGSFSFVVLAKHKHYVDNLLRSGTEFIAFGIGFRIESDPSFTEIPASEQPVRAIAVSISLGGKWANYLDKLVPLRQSRISTTNGKDLECLQEQDNNSVRRLPILSCQELAARVGASFSAPGRWQVRIPRDTQPNQGIALASALTERSRINRCFLDYSDPNAIRGKRFDQTSKWRVEEADVRSEVTSGGTQSINLCPEQFQPPDRELYPQICDDAPLPSAPLPTPVPELRPEPAPRPSKVYWPRYRIDGQFVQEYLKRRDRRQKDDAPKWRRKPDVEIIIEEGSIDAHLPPDPNGFVTKVSECFDQSGQQKVITRTTLRNGTAIKIETKTYGFVVYGDQLFYLTSEGEWRSYYLTATALWTIVEEKTTVIHFEEKYGYKIGSTTTGRRLIRFRQESESPPETASILFLNTGTVLEDLLDSADKLSAALGSIFQEVQSADVVETAVDEPESGFLSQALYQIDPLYRFQWQPILEEECRTLEPLSKYYPPEDQPQSDAANKRCLPNGQALAEEEKDPNQVPEYFVKDSWRMSSGNIETINPEWQLQDEIWTRLGRIGEDSRPKAPLQPILQTGKFSIEERSIEPVAKGKGIRNHFDPVGTRIEEEDFYIEFVNQYESKGAGYDQKLQEATFSQSTGRPPVAERLNIQWEQVASEKDEKVKEPDEFVWYVKSPVDDCAKKGIENAGYAAINYQTASSTSSYSRELEGGSLSYSSAETLAEAKAAAETELFLDNVNGMGQESFSVKFTPEYRPGDRIFRTINGWHGERMILSASHELNIQGDFQGRPLVTGSTQLSLGKIPKIDNLIYQKEKVPQAQDKNRDNPRDRQIGNLGTIECKIKGMQSRYSRK